VPLYEFECEGCGALFEELVAAGVLPPCPACGGERVARRWSSVAPARLPFGLTGAAAKDSEARRTEREAGRLEAFSAERKRRKGG
jgi:putative FmdB family regulatory protein